MQTVEPAVECTTIEEKIAMAQDLFRNWGDALRQDTTVGSLLESLRQRIELSGKAMVEVGVVAACRHCEEVEGGSCCGAGIENRYNTTYLLMNLLLGGILPEKRLSAKGCFFLGATGCTLLARTVLCVNFLCLGIQKILLPEELIRLQTITGDEMDTGFLLHEAVKKCMRRSNTIR